MDPSEHQICMIHFQNYGETDIIPRSFTSSLLTVDDSLPECQRQESRRENIEMQRMNTDLTKPSLPGTYCTRITTRSEKERNDVESERLGPLLNLRPSEKRERKYRFLVALVVHSLSDIQNIVFWTIPLIRYSYRLHICLEIILIGYTNYNDVTITSKTTTP